MSNLNSKIQKEIKLNMSVGKANYILSKKIIYHFAKILKKDCCYRCGDTIENLKEFSIEHKIDWLHSNNPSGNFFKYGNISFSHLECNVANRYKNKYETKKNKNEVLGMNFSTANNRLRKIILYNLCKELKLINCYRCNENIESVEEFSKDHLVDWLYSKNPVDLFFDVENIKFSHLKCNSKFSKLSKKGKQSVIKSSERKRIVGPEGFSWCSISRHFSPNSEFTRRRSRWNGLDSKCKKCKSLYMKQMYIKQKNNINVANICISCKTEISNSSVTGYCRSCSATIGNKSRIKHAIPKVEVLVNDFLNFTYTQMEEKYKVSTNTIKRWLKSYDLPTSKYELRKVYKINNK